MLLTKLFQRKILKNRERKRETKGKAIPQQLEKLFPHVLCVDWKRVVSDAPIV